MRSILAVANNTLKQALRMKIALVFIVLLLLILPAMALNASGDGTPKGRLQTFVSYGVSLTSFLLSLLTIFVCIHTVTSDLVQRQVYTVLTKPLRRYQFLLGKFLGVVLLNLALLIGFSAFIYGITEMTPKFMELSHNQARELANEFYAARASLIPAEPDVTEEEVNQEYERLKNNQVLEQYFEGASTAKIKDWLYQRLKLEKGAVDVGQQKIWEFSHVKPLDPNDKLFVRFKYDVSVTPPDEQVYSQWIVGDNRMTEGGPPITTPVYSTAQESPTGVRKDPVRTYREFEVPAEVIADDGYVAVGFLNVPQLNNTVVIFSPDRDGESRIKVLFKAGSFLTNYLRGVLIIFFRLIFLAALALLSATFLSFPVAILLCTVVFFTVSISGFVIESFEYLGDALSKIYGNSVELVIKALPQFDKYNPSDFLVDAQLITWQTLGWAALTIAWAVLLLGLGLIVFQSKELAQDTS